MNITVGVSHTVVNKTPETNFNSEYS
uniref:Uncharacterized protein n=1 Tax=Anguilla anguilla TaxID=7936 RepID=A0A0E9R8C6_ANGAN